MNEYDYQLMPIDIYCDLLEDESIDTSAIRQWINILAAANTGYTYTPNNRFYNNLTCSGSIWGIGYGYHFYSSNINSMATGYGPHSVSVYRGDGNRAFNDLFEDDA